MDQKDLKGLKDEKDPKDSKDLIPETIVFRETRGHGLLKEIPGDPEGPPQEIQSFIF